MAQPLTLYKLIVLYMLDRVDFPLSTSQISEFVLDKGYTTYFKLQQALIAVIFSVFKISRIVQMINYRTKDSRSKIAGIHIIQGIQITFHTLKMTACLLTEISLF